VNRVKRRRFIREQSTLRRVDGTTATKSPIALRVALSRRRSHLAKVSRRAGR